MRKQTMKTRSITRVLSLLASVLVLGCSSTASSPVLERNEMGAARVLVNPSSAQLVSSIARVTVTITAPDISPISVDLAQSGSNWQGTIGGIPPGVRDFAIVAYDASNAPLYQGASSGVTIVGGQTAQVNVRLEEVTPPSPFQNDAPVITSTSISSATVVPGGTVSISVDAFDPNGDALSFGFSANGGTFNNMQQPSLGSATIDWIAPSVEGTYSVSAVVTDAHQATSTLAITLTVSSATSTGAAAVVASFNDAPLVNAILSQGPEPLQAGTEIFLAANVTDSNGDGLAYSWSAVGCSGTFGTPTGSSTTFDVSAIDPGYGTCEFRVDVDDGKGGTNYGLLDIEIYTPSQTVNRLPVIDSFFQSSNIVTASAPVSFSVQTHDDDGDAINYRWDITSSGLTETLSSSGNTAQLSVTNCNGFVPQTVTVTAYDWTGQGNSQDFIVDTCQ
jgi:hypothetical protein